MCLCLCVCDDAMKYRKVTYFAHSNGIEYDNVGAAAAKAKTEREGEGQKAYLLRCQLFLFN